MEKERDGMKGKIKISLSKIFHMAVFDLRRITVKRTFARPAFSIFLCPFSNWFREEHTFIKTEV